MGSEYDEFSIRSHFSYKNLSEKERENRNLLRQTMQKNDFVPINSEWWHFEFVDARKFHKLNDPFPCEQN
jgi:D-alanyl-D-alanine dipeptidase